MVGVIVVSVVNCGIIADFGDSVDILFGGCVFIVSVMFLLLVKVLLLL